MTRYLAFGVLIAAMLASFPASAEELRLTTLYRTGTFTKGGGKANVVMRDVVGDARPDIISCNYGGSAYAVSYDGQSLSYRDRWISPDVGCTAVGAGDRDGTGFNKVFVAGTPGGFPLYPGASGPSYLFVFDATSYGPELAKVLVSATEPVTSIAVGNVDGDAGLEVVAITSTKFYVFNAATFALKWSGPYGGHTVAIGDLEGDGKNEIIIGASNDGHVLDAYTKTYKWGYFGGFGPSMTVGDVDNDGKAEIIGGTAIYSGAPTVKIINGDTMTTSTISARAEAVAVGDANNDGQNELIVGPDQWGNIEGYTVSGTKLWSINNPSWGTVGIVVGDPDGDGKNEVVWASHDPGLFVGNANTQTLESTPDDFDGPFRIAVADLNGDGRLEMVVTSATANGHDYIPVGTAYVLDYTTHRLIAKLPIPQYYAISQIAIGQVDGDAAREIVVLASDHDGGRIFVFDGVTFALEWSSPVPPCCNSPQPALFGLIVRDINGDGIDEIIYATTENRIQVLNGAGPFIEYTTPVLDSMIYDMDIADVDGDGVLDLAVATQTGAYIFKTSDWSQRTYIPLTSLGGRTIAAAPGHFSVSLSGDGIATYSGNTLAQEWSCNSGNTTSDLAFVMLGGTLRLAAAMSDSTLRFFPASSATCPAYDTVSQMVGYDAHNPSYLPGRVQIAFADLNGDGRSELLSSSSWDASISVLGSASEPRGDADSDGVVTDFDIDALAAYFYGNRTATQPAGDVNADGVIRPDDLFYLINYRRGTGAPPPASMPSPSGTNP